ncbi:5-hydroxytryptamine receptor 3A-like protein [Labeo rohita]|uniref:5-hydroxytryptamine receptor 3A-like protein n=1 Tax=Labeo rohita TaxID=84645 RepID=A0A498M2G4_LABRO|nr:5-hydroxytryptamine receptor 3A-like protein [Labeo rohita]
MKKEIRLCLSSLKENFSCNLAVTTRGQVLSHEKLLFTEKEEEMLTKVKQVFGKDVLKHVIILFTYGDECAQDTVQSEIGRNRVVGRVIRSCHGFHVFNNKDQNNREQVNDLLRKIDTMVWNQGYYTRWVSAATSCEDSTVYGTAYMALFERLGLNKTDVLNTHLLPYFMDPPTDVYVDLYVTSIIEVNEKAQSLSTQVKMMTITIRRRPLLYVINIIIPVFFFLVLDVTSFFITASGADKLSFKVTLLLSISVLLLILHDRLPSTADKIPLIGIYCSVVFSLIGISILETIFVTFLMDKGAEKRSVENTAAVSGQDIGVSAAVNCSNTDYTAAYKALFEHLGLDKNGDQMTHMRPFSWSPVTYVYVSLFVTSIIDVNEKAQSFSTQVKMLTAWINRNMDWNENEFCGMETLAAQKNMLWTPDIGIVESIKTEFGAKESPYVQLTSFGLTMLSDVLSLTTACKMDLYRFPFDIQSCNLTLQSSAHTDRELKVTSLFGSEWLTSESKHTFQAQGEWEFISINTAYSNNNFLWGVKNQLIYQITIKRRPLLYLVNFMLPIFFFLVLDVMSFFIVANEADKLSFKVTLLLSISVMLLILNDTLPSTADKIPLIGESNLNMIIMD